MNEGGEQAAHSISCHCNILTDWADNEHCKISGPWTHSRLYTMVFSLGSVLKWSLDILASCSGLIKLHIKKVSFE